MATDQGPVVMSALLRAELVRLRKGRNLTQEQVAAELDWSNSKLIRLEGGHNAITKVDLDALLAMYGVTSEDERERLQALGSGARSRGWWDNYREQLSAEYLKFVGYEAGASYIRQYQEAVVPGLLQTLEYAQALTAATIQDKAKLTSAVQLRMLRQSELAKRNPRPRQYFVLDEAVVRRHVGIAEDPAIMPAQLQHLAAVARDDERRTTIRVIPFTAGAYPGLSGAFTLLEFEGDFQDILYLDSGRDVISVIPEDARVAEFAEAFESLLKVALSADASIDFILEAARDMSLSAPFSERGDACRRQPKVV
jgi:transcriptional regulator with XRE-family HTH domain